MPTAVFAKPTSRWHDWTTCTVWVIGFGAGAGVGAGGGGPVPLDQ